MKRRHVLAAMLGGTSALVVGWSVLPARQRLLPSTSLADSPDQPLMLVNYASLNQLVLDLPIGHALYNWAESINVFLVWQLWILFAGLQSAAGFTAKRAAIVTGTPVLLIFGLWALFA